MTTETTEAPRARRDGELCPAWCTADHHTPYATTKSGRDLYYDVHFSDQIATGFPGPMVRLFQFDAGEPVMIDAAAWLPGGKQESITLTAEQAEQLAAFLPVLAGSDQFAAELTAAAAIARATQ